ncbi:MAG: MinD/ParA family protein [Alicyclobacillus sp.]|nr:MinD/ParA family protein [Alicyclobacillus sp.]
MMQDQAAMLRQRLAPQPDSRNAGDIPGSHRVIAVASGKGGVGKSNFCVNFAIGLRQAGLRPIVIDADIGFANIEVLLGVRPTRTIADVLSGLDIWDVVQESASGVSFLSAGNGLMDIHALSSEQMDRLLSELHKLQELYDTIIIDSGAGLGGNLSRLIGAADDLILMTTPEPTALTDAYALIKQLAARNRLPCTQILVNRVSTLVDGKLAADKLRMVVEHFLAIQLSVLGYVLEDDSVSRAVMLQTALLTAFPNSPAARCITQLVHNYLNLDVASERRGFSKFLERLKRAVRYGRQVDSGHSA